ncbi:hypothetical protein OB13_07635 [Pontibacter sp. HJ8]
MPLAAALLILLLFSSCENSTDTTADAPPEPAGITYKIPKGSHATQSPVKFINSSLIRFEAVFNTTAIYTLANSANQADINKLYGVSDCGTEHHTNSARFGWRWYNGQLEIHAYTYQNKKRNTAYIGAVALGKPSLFEIRIEDNRYTFHLNEKQVVMERNCTGTGGGYQLYPYFGGDEVAPHDITIGIKELH